MERPDNIDCELINILLVDDRADHLVALESVLKSDQYQLMTASSGEEALKLILKHEFAVILMDVQMPGMNGFETTKLIKMRESSMHIPIIFITAVSKTHEHVLHGYSVGAIDYIVKPFHPETLRLKIDGFVKLYRNRQQLWRQSELLWKGTLEIGYAQSSWQSPPVVSDPNAHPARSSDSAYVHPSPLPSFPTDTSYGQTITILESIADAFFAVDSEWRFTYVNQEAERRFGISRVELMGSSLWSIPELLTRADVYAILQQAYAEQAPAHFEYNSQDETKWFEIRAYPSASGFSIYFNEVTERKRMELELQRSQQYFRQIFNLSPSLMALCGTDGVLSDVNESWVRYTGYSLEEIRGQSLDVFRIEADGEDEGQAPPSVIDSPATNRKVSYATKQGDKREGLLSTELLDVQGQRHILCVITDITERVQMDKQIARLGQLNLVGEMAAGIAHEIRNPMTTVRGFLQLSKADGNNEFADIMIEELDRANAIITEFLSLAKNLFSNQKLQPLNAIIDFLYPLMQAEAVLLGKRVELELGDCPELMLDEKEIRQVILNMVKNGLDAMESGGVVTLRTYAEPDAGVLEIDDQGSGIPDSVAEKIGTPFFTTKENGTGLGLAVCYSIANRHRATIDVRTGKEGTTFTIRFPLQHSDSYHVGE